MAIVKTLRSGTAVVNIDDSCCANMNAEALKRRRDRIDDAIWRINRHSQRATKDDAAKRG